MAILRLGQTSLVFSIIAVIGGSIVKPYAKVGGWIMIGSGIAIFITSCFYNALGIFPATVLIAAGLTSISRKTHASHSGDVSS
ncbi:hypothetical protein [Salipaludibacillus agaradhaerens]|uniref:hypothetical protein n=1 Tax=Salipaludibacillus agaradhaerens TaxID=76935 RepID=UPI00117DAAC7|nr:hypothetical protein [Salipaludibacillus agaradhaerens]